MEDERYEAVMREIRELRREILELRAETSKVGRLIDATSVIFDDGDTLPERVEKVLYRIEQPETAVNTTT